VIRNLDQSKNQQTSAPHLNKLKAELQEKEKYIKQIEVRQGVVVGVGFAHDDKGWLWEWALLMITRAGCCGDGLRS